MILTFITIVLLLILFVVFLHVVTFAWLYDHKYEGTYPEFLFVDDASRYMFIVFAVCSFIPLVNIAILGGFIISLIELWFTILWYKYRCGMSKEEISKSIP